MYISVFFKIAQWWDTSNIQEILEENTSMDLYVGSQTAKDTAGQNNLFLQQPTTIFVQNQVAESDRYFTLLILQSRVLDTFIHLFVYVSETALIFNAWAPRIGK